MTPKNSLSAFAFRSTMTLLMMGLLWSPSLVSAQYQDEENPLLDLLTDTAALSSLENVNFSMQVSPQVVQVGDTVEYRFEILNMNETPIENVRLTHVLPFGLNFINFENLDGNVSVGTTNQLNDTLILKGLYLSELMESPFVFTIQAVVNDWSADGILYNQAILDITAADTHEQITSDADPETWADDQTALVVVPSETTILTPQQTQILINQSPTNTVIYSGGSGKRGNRWAGMKREELLKGAMGVSSEVSRAHAEKRNAGVSAQIKTYVDRNGKTKFYGIIPGKLSQSKFTTATKSRPTYRPASKPVVSKKPTTTNQPVKKAVSSNRPLTIVNNISTKQKKRSYYQSFSGLENSKSMQLRFKAPVRRR